jgi:NAD(P)-dependent dehydrogenase (short-subunit alcohol dehydrogenase family)
VNNAGINPSYGPMIEMDLDIARKIVELNCIAALAWTQAVHQAWMGEHEGAVVNVASVAAIRAAPGIGIYGASKAMLAHITEELAVELGPGHPSERSRAGGSQEEVRRRALRGQEEKLASTYPLKRLGVPDDINSVVTFLLSDDAAWMTGQMLVIDGGLTHWRS